MVYYVHIVINHLRVRKYGLKILKIIVLTLIMFVLYLKIGSQKSNGMMKSRENLF